MLSFVASIYMHPEHLPVMLSVHLYKEANIILSSPFSSIPEEQMANPLTQDGFSIFASSVMSIAIYAPPQSFEVKMNQ